MFITTQGDMTTKGNSWEDTMKPANMDAENGPVCACGKSSTHQSGWCGTPCEFVSEQVNIDTEDSLAFLRARPRSTLNLSTPNRKCLL